MARRPTAFNKLRFNSCMTKLLGTGLAVRRQNDIHTSHAASTVSMAFILAFCLLVADWTSERHMHTRLPRKRPTAGTIDIALVLVR